jgi:serine/threonine protein kinase
MAVTDADAPEDGMVDGLIAGRYRLVERLGSGSMGEVWRAHDERLDRTVAVKQLLPLTGIAAQRGTEFAMREARITARLRHPNAVTVHDVVEHDGQPCLVMSYVPGPPLAGSGPLAPVEAARIGQQVASALAAAHEVGIVHRDVKPDNVLRTEDGTAMITDFGISRMAGDASRTGPGIVVGTPAYLAPEVAAGADASYASDVFSLGATLYAAVQGTPPFGFNDNTIALLQSVAACDVPPPTRAGPLGPVLMWMLRREPTARPTMAQVSDALGAVADGRPVVPPTATLLLDTTPRRPSGRTVAVTLAATALVALGLVVGIAIGNRPTTTIAAPTAHTKTVPPPPTTTTPACIADYTLTNSWPGGYQAQVTVTAGQTTLDGWTVTLDLPNGQTITSLWNGSLSQQGTSARVANLNYNATVTADTSTSFGFLGSVTRDQPTMPAVHCSANQ